MLTFGISVALYFLLHSFLAANAVKKCLLRTFISERFYRLSFNALAVILLLPLVFLFLKIEQKPLFANQDWLTLPGWLLVAAGIIWMVRALAGYDLGEFFGILQLKTGKPPVHNMLKTNGLNRLVRHPLYFGMLQLFWGAFLLSPTNAVLLLVVLGSVYLFIGVRLEERKLAQQFGEAYRSYQAAVPMLLPVRFGRRRV